MMSDEYYRILEISKDAKPEEIQKAYRKLARKYHPDLNQNDPAGAKQKFQQVQEAYDILGNPEKRRIYDQFGVSPDQMGSGGGQGPFQWSFSGGQGPHPFRGGTGGNFNLDDILSMFGGGGAGAEQNPEEFFNGMGAGLGRRPARGADLERTLPIPFVLAVQGGDAEMKIRRANGKTETISVKIPPGIVDGKKIRLAGLGNPGRDGGKAGNLLVTIQIEDHPFFTRKEDNLYVHVPVTLQEAVFGAKIDVPTPKGNVKLTIPAGSSSGTKLRIRGCGVSADGHFGDLFAELSVVLPKNWSDEDKRLLEKLKTKPAEPIRAKLSW